MSKLIIVIWANCQGGAIQYMLEKLYSHMFIVNRYSNYEFINNKYILPDEIKNADIFLFQNYSDRTDEYDINNITKLLKNDCLKICFPTLHSCHLLFCYETNEPNNSKTINTEYPHGKFYYGIAPIIDLIQKYNVKNLDEGQKNIIIDEIYNLATDENFISNEKIEYYYNRSFEFLENKILSSDIPYLLEFIKENFTKVRLWHNPNHPSGVLLNELVKNIFKKLNLVYNENNIINELDNQLNDWVMPILPSVKKYYNMQFDDNCSSKWHNNITDTKSYICKYLNELYFTKDV